jgi:TolB-like protein/TolA-binding protein
MKKERSVFAGNLVLAAILLLPSSGAGQEAADLYNSGLEHVRAQRWQQATDVLKQAAAKNPKDADVQFQLGYAYHQLGQFDEAVKHLKQASGLKPGDDESNHWLGHSHFALGQYDDAVKAYRETVRLNPADADAFTHLGVAYTYVKNFKDAAEAFRGAVRLQPKDAMAHFNLGFAEMESNQTQKAGSSFQQAIRLDPMMDDDKGIDSLAVLPFFNGSNDLHMEYLSDGITESIMNSLSVLPQLKVIARSTVFRYKGMAVDPREVGRALGVRAVMMGRVQQRGERLVINAELVNVRDGSRIWGDQYHRKSSDIFSLQEELAREISEKLCLRLSGEQKEQLRKRFTENREAYEFYLRGRYACARRTIEDLKSGVEYFRRAIAKDPNYSLAYAGIADCLVLLGQFGAEHPRLIMPQAKAAR